MKRIRQLCLPFLLLPSLASGEVIHFKDPARKPLTAEVTSYHDGGLTAKIVIPLSGGLQGSSAENIPFSAIDFLEFPPLEGEADALANPTQTDLTTWKRLWLAKLAQLARPKSNAGEIGLLYAERLLTEPSEYGWAHAMDIFVTIVRSDWNQSHHARAKRGRLRALIVSGKVEEAVREAQQMAAGTEDPVILLEAKYVLGRAAFAQLQALQKEHPRWMEDDEVIPKRTALLNDALDQFLHAYLFFGSEEAAAAQGLLGAAEVHRFAGDFTNAKHCAEDIVRLYPQAPVRSAADELIAALPPSSIDTQTQAKP